MQQIYEERKRMIHLKMSVRDLLILFIRLDMSYIKHFK